MKIALFFLVLLILSLTPVAASIVGVSPGSITFKDLLRGGYAERPITITIDSADLVNVTIEANGDIKNWINISQTSILVSKENLGRVVISANVPQGVPNGNYTGYIRVGTAPVSGKGVENHAMGIVRAVIDVSIKAEIVDLEYKKCTAKDFRIDSVEKGDSVPVKLDFVNEGNIRLKPQITVDLWDQDKTSIIKTLELTSNPILPTKETTLNLNFSSANIDVGEYWASISAIDCYSSEDIPLEIFEPGVLKTSGKLLKITIKSFAEAGETIPLYAMFKNTGEKNVNAKFKGKITLGDKIVPPLLESEEIDVPIQETANFSFFFTPQKEGKYIITGRVFYANKKSFESAAYVNVLAGKSKKSGFFPQIIYLVVAILIIIFIYKIRKQKRDYLQKIRSLKLK